MPDSKSLPPGREFFRGLAAVVAVNGAQSNGRSDCFAG